jgi:endoglucanase
MTTSAPRPLFIKSLTALSGVSLFAAVGCAGSPTSEQVRATPEGSACSSPDALIDDAEDNNNQTAVVGGRGGYWYTFVDDAGTTVWPTAGAQGGTFEMSPGGADGSKYAAHFKGQIGTGSVVFVGAGMNFVDPKGPYDTSKYKGISFFAKKGVGSTGKVRLKMPDNYTDPDGGNCSQCFNDMGVDLTLTDAWQLFTIPFKSLRQMPGWGRPRRMSVDQPTMYGMQFQVNDPGQPYDIWVDQIRFTGCGG